MGRGRMTSMVVASVSAAALLASDASAAVGAGKPSNFAITVNGQRLTAQQLVPRLDTYVAVPKGPFRVAVNWTTNLRGTNHIVIVSSSDGVDRKRCVTGTSCVLATKWSLRPKQVTCFGVLVFRGLKQVSDRELCVIGKR